MQFLAECRADGDVDDDDDAAADEDEDDDIGERIQLCSIMIISQR